MAALPTRAQSLRDPGTNFGHGALASRSTGPTRRGPRAAAWLLLPLLAALPWFVPCVVRAADAEAQVTLDGSLSHYEAHAVQHSPALRAAHERWRAGLGRVSGEKALPGPMLSFGYFVRSVETRTGPQRARLGLSQTFPWPAGLKAAANAARAEVDVLERRLAARTLQLTRQVDEAYWQLWLVRRAHELHHEHLGLLQGLSESAGARVATGQSSLADQQQIDLTIARLGDQLHSLDSAERSAEARLRAVLAVSADTELRTETDPPPALPVAESEAKLRQQAMVHPALHSLRLQARVSDARAEAERAERFPSFTVGVDWILTGDAPTALPDSGKDAVIVGGGVRLPLWQRGPREAAEAARAEARAQRAEHDAAQLEAVAELQAALAEVDDAARRTGLFRDTLLPQAEGAFESVLGAYATGRATVSAALLSQQDLLDLRVELEQIRARYAQAWARLEDVVGKPVHAGAPADRGAELEGAHE